MKITLLGEPVAKSRPRICRKGAYDPQVKLKNAAKFQVLDFFNRLGLNKPFSCPLSIQIKFTLRIPKGMENLCKWNLLPCVSKPDIDNLAKFYLDVMNEIVYEDDSQVVSLSLIKQYGDEHKTEIFIMEKKDKVSEKVKKILNIFDPKMYVDFIDQINEIEHFCNLDYEDPYISEQNHREAALIICEFAGKYAKVLSKIDKQFPGFAKELKEEKNKLESI